MKRSRRWLLIFSALIGLMAHAGALRATSLIFPKAPTTTKTTTTTTTTTESPANEDEHTTELAESLNTTDSKLTGIPQIDYVWDPNLPRELNGYNLSDYPFFSTVPPNEEIDFKCKGLHDGFYASVQYKCQLYHHCLYGVRYDFLCANFTAFDQKTFICHFVSEVDCKNSPKYWHRNDALYKATTTSTTTTTTTTTVAPPPDRRPVRPLRRPLRRRRPQVDYYYYDDDYEDDFYDERSNRRRKQRPRPRRPDYDEDYDSQRSHSDDDRYEKRPYARDRDRERARDADDEHEYNRRPSDRPKTRNRPGDRRHTDEERAERRKSGDRRRPVEDRRLAGDDRRLAGDERRLAGDDRRLAGEDRTTVAEEKSPGVSERRPSIFDRRHPPEDRRSFNADRRHPKDRSRNPPPEDDDYVNEENRRPNRRRLGGDRPGRRNEEDREELPLETPEKNAEPEVAPVVPVKPTGSGSGSLFGRPRAPPKISRPVPLTERKKFEYTTKKTPTTTASAIADDEYYDDYEDEPPKSPPPREEKVEKPIPPPPPPSPQSPKVQFSPIRRPFGPPAAIREDPKNRYEIVKDPVVEDDYEDEPVVKSKYKPVDRNGPRGGFKKDEMSDEEETSRYYTRQRDEREDPPPARGRIENDRSPSRDPDKIPERFTSRERERDLDQRTQAEEDRLKPIDIRFGSEEASKSAPSSGSSEEEPIKDARPIVRVVKRPFLPSRGGSPYLPRGLQPVGVAHKPSATESTPIDMGSTISGVRLLEHAAPIVRGSINPNDFPPPQTGPRTTQRPQVEPPRSSLDDIYENEYDVTLNDALNPTLKPLTPNRGLPSGFSHTSKFDRSRFSSPSGTYNYASDAVYSSTDVRRTAVQAPAAPANSRSQSSQSRSAQTYYDDYEDY